MSHPIEDLFEAFSGIILWRKECIEIEEVIFQFFIKFLLKVKPHILQYHELYFWYGFPTERVASGLHSDYYYLKSYLD